MLMRLISNLQIILNKSQHGKSTLFTPAFIYFQTRKESDFVTLVNHLKSFSSCETTFLVADATKATVAIG